MRAFFALALVAVPVFAAGDGYTIEHFSKEISFHADGTWVAEQSAIIDVASDAAVRRFGNLSFSYAADSQTVSVLSVRVHKTGAVDVETPAQDAREIAGTVNEDAPVYSDARRIQVPVRSLQCGDVLEYRVRFTQFRPESSGHFWYSQQFLKDKSVAQEELTIRIPERKYAQVVSSTTAEVRIDRGEKVYHWSSTQGREVSVQVTTFKNWQDLGTWYERQFSPEAAVTAAVQAKADEITHGLKTAEQKQRALYDYVSTHFRYVAVALGTGKYRPHTAEQVLTNQYGDCKDKHTLLTALLKAEGIEAWPALVGSDTLNTSVPSPEYFNHVVTVVGDTWLDATPEIAPYGLLQPELRGVKALLLRGESAQLVTTPEEPSFAGSQELVSNATLSRDGMLSAHMQLTLRGDDEFAVRAAFHRAPIGQRPALVQALVKNLGLSGAVKQVTISSPEDLESPFHIAFDYEQRNYSDWANLRIAQPVLPFIFSADANDAKPSEPVRIGIVGEMVHRVTLKLPAQLVADLPNGRQIETPFATYTATYGQVEDTIVAESHIVIRQPKIAPGDWDAYLDFVKQVKDEEFGYTQLADAGALQAHELIEAAMGAIGSRDYDRAREQLQQAARLSPHEKGLWSTCAQLAAATGDKAAAVEAQRREAAGHPDSVTARLDLAGLFLDNGNAADAAALLHQIADASEDPAVLNNAAFMLAEHRTDAADAVSYARRAVELLEKRMSDTTLGHLSETDLRDVEALASLWDTLGFALQTAGNEPEARRYLAASWVLNRNRSARQHLNDLGPEPRRSLQVTPAPAKGSADFFLLFTGNRLVDAQFINGDEHLKAIAPMLLAQSFPPLTPDGGPEHIVRRATADCSASSCTVTLLWPSAATR